MKPRVLFVDHVCRILGGAEVNLVELLGDASSRPPWDVVVACDPRGPLHQALGEAGVERVPFELDAAIGQLRVVGRRFPLAAAASGWRALRKARQSLHRLVEELRPVAVISCTNKDHFAAWPACRALGIRSIWWVNDILSPAFFPWMARRAFVHQARQGAHRLVAVSQFARRALLDEGVPPDRVVTILNGIPLERYPPQPRGCLRSQLGIAEGAPLIGILGRLTPWKGQDLFLRLASEWTQAEPTAHFALIGHAFNEDQAFESQLRDFAARQGHRDRIHFVPFQKNVAAALADLDVLVHASLKPEPFGRVLIEAMAVGTPVLAARAGGVPEIVTEGGNGLLATPGDPTDYLGQLRRLLSEPGLRERIRETGRNTVAQRFSLQRVRGNFSELVAIPA